MKFFKTLSSLTFGFALIALRKESQNRREGCHMEFRGSINYPHKYVLKIAYTLFLGKRIFHHIYRWLLTSRIHVSLSGKTNVLSTSKVFNTEVENQLDKEIKIVRLDKGWWILVANFMGYFERSKACRLYYWHNNSRFV